MEDYNMGRRRKYQPGYDPNRPIPPVYPGGYGPDNKHHGFQRTCSHCGVSAKIGLRTLVESIRRGLADQNLALVSTAPESQVSIGTLPSALKPLIKTLNAKGFVVNDKPQSVEVNENLTSPPKAPPKAGN